MVEFGFKEDRTEISKTGVESGPVIKGFDVVEDRAPSLGEGGEALVIDHFVFEAAPEGLDEGVVVAVTFAAHGSEEAVLGEDLPVSGAGKLHAAIRVNDESSSGAPLEERHAQGGDDEAGIEDLRGRDGVVCGVGMGSCLNIRHL